jgi:(E)-4-hydroxy-3-methylbut-2-enyl-diphosphate synthase
MTRQVSVANVAIGGNATIGVQSMAKAQTSDVRAVLEQCVRVAQKGGDIMRVSVPDEHAAAALPQIVAGSPIPIVADIHFDYRLALLSIEAGVHKLRINPGNIGSSERVKIVAQAARDRGIPIRIGVNAGSIPKDLLEHYGSPTPEAMVAAAAREIEVLENSDFTSIVVSMKSSSPHETFEANRLFSTKFDYPLHIGITEAGFGYQGVVASTIGISRMLSAGIGDTIRVSLTDEPEVEAFVGREILRFLGLRNYGIRLISCPKCSRCTADTFTIARNVWNAIATVDKNLEIAVMGCVVNGPGEARNADFGVAIGNNNRALLFSHGEPLKTISIESIIDEIKDLVKE